MSEWNTVKLADAPLEILDGDRGKNYPSQDEFSDYGYCLFLSTKNVRSIGFDFSECQFVSKVRDELLRKGRLQRNDVVLTTRGTVGNLGFFNDKVGYEKIRINSGMVIIRPDESKLFPAFNFYTFRKLQSDFLTFTSGSAQPQLPIRDLKEIEISIPPLEEQKAIASVLSSLDDKIDLLHRQNNTLERMAETLFRQWFVEEAQEDWEEVKLGDFIEINKKSINKTYPFNQIEYLDTGSLTEGKVDSLQSYMINEAPSRALRLVEHNDVLISTVRPNQKHYGIINNPIENLVVSSGFCVLTCTKISPHFVYLLLTNNEMTEYLHSIAEGSTSTYPSLKPSDIAAITFQLPPNQKLADFAKIANDSWDKIHKNYKQIQTLEKLRDNLLPKLMSGEVRVI
ncbi:MAG: restriction endonuclease subunit S [Methylotenera sp.]|nr:restriction endonuclease subunit S [Methylotenera sp.]